MKDMMAFLGRGRSASEVITGVCYQGKSGRAWLEPSHGDQRVSIHARTTRLQPTFEVGRGGDEQVCCETLKVSKAAATEAEGNATAYGLRFRARDETSR